MANKRTKKFQTLPVQQYQFGGLPFLDQYQKLGNQWDTFWRGGNYFSPGNVPPTGVYADPKAMLYNTVGNNNATAAAYKANQQILKDNPYTGEWGDDAHNYYYNKTLNGAYTESELSSFGNFEKQNFSGNPQAAHEYAYANNINADKYNAWYNGRKNYANQAGAQFDSEKSKRAGALAEQPAVNKQMGDAFANTAAGVFSGLNYINAYVPPEDISLMQGDKGIMYSKKGGNVNLTGYTPGTSTNNNKSNTIPSGQISMEKTPFDIIAIGKGKGADRGLVKDLKANSPGYNFKTSFVFEIPKDRQQAKEASQKAEMQDMQKQMQQQGVQIAQKGATVKPTSKNGNIKTFKTDPEYFNNKTFEPWQIQALSTGNVGIDENGVLHKLDEKVQVPQEWLDVTSNNYDKSNTKEKWQADARQQQAMQGLNEFYNNPLSGVMGAGLASPGRSMLNYVAKQAGEQMIGNTLNTYRDSLQRQYGGNMNMTGYTPGTPTMQNDMNEIPSGNITMEQTPIPLLAIGKKGADNGLLKILQPNSKGYNFKSKSTVEIPLEQQTQEQMIPTAQYGFNNPFYLNPLQSMQFGGIAMGANNLYNGQNQQAAYLNELSGGDPNSPYSYVNATPEFNARMAASMPQNYGQKAAPVVPTQTGQFVPSSGMFPQQAAYTQPLPGDTTGYNPSNFKIKKGGTQKVAAYQQMLREKGYDIEVDGAWGPKTQAAYEALTGKKAPSKTAVNTGKAKVASNVIKAAGNTLTGSSRAGINPEYLTGSGPQGMQLAYDPITGQETLISTGGAPASTPQGNSPLFGIGSAAVGNPNRLTSRWEAPQPQGGYNNPGATSYLNNRAMGVYAPASNNVKGTLIDYPSISEQRGETESRAFGLLKMTPEEAASYDSFFNKLAPTVKNKPSYLKVLDQERQQLGSKINKLNSEINSMKPGVSTTDWQRKTREIKQKELQELQQELLKVETTYSKKEKQFSTPTTTRYGKPRTKRNEVNPKLFGSNVDPRLNKFLNNIGLYQYGGEVPKFQFGGSVNDEHATPIFSSNLEEFGLTELQTEKNEVAFMPDGSIVDVKAKELHKKQDKHNVSDIMQSGTYVFSNDPKMKFGIKSKLGGVELGEMNLGKSVFKYKENEITPGPEKIMLKDMFFNGSKKELTTAEIAKNIKKNIPIVDLKNDYFADRAIAENKDQRIEYLSILKAFNEYKKPADKNIPKAQYGMPIQPTQNGLDGVMGYGKNIMDPLKKMDNNIVSMFNFKQPSIPELPKPYNYGGDIPQAQFGWLADGIDAIGGWSRRAEKKQRQKNSILALEAQKYRDGLQDSVDRSGTVGIGTNLATYAASLNVPLQKYDDQSEQMSIFNAAANQARQRLEASKYTASQGIGSASSLARYNNPVTYGNFLAQTQSQNDSTVGKINQAIADLDMARANANVGFVSARNTGRNNALNTRDTQLYNANVAGIGNVGKSIQESIYNSGDTRYRLGMEKMSYDAYLEDRAKAAKQQKQQQIRGYGNEIGGLATSIFTGGIPIPGLTPDANMPNSNKTTGFNPNQFQWQNPNQAWQQSPANQQFNSSYRDTSGYNWSSVPGSSVNRPPYINPLLSALTNYGFGVYGG